MAAGGTYSSLTIDPREISALAAIRTNLKGISSTAQQSVSALSSATRSLGAFAGLAGGVYAVKKAFDATTQAAIGFDRAMHNVWTLTDRSLTSLQALGSEVRSLARGYNVTAQEAAQALYQIKSATF